MVREEFFREDFPYRTFRHVHRESLECYCLINESGVHSFRDDGPVLMTHPLPEPGFWDAGKYYLPWMDKDDPRVEFA
jgi:hypothetical protein